MKKYIVIMLITLVGLSTTSKAQKKGSPLLPTKNGGAFYSKTELQNHIYSHADYKKEFLAVINEDLANAGEKIFVTENNVEWIFNHIEFSQKTLISFRNSYRIGNLIYFFDDANYTGIIGTFHYGNCHEDVIKAVCGNLLKKRVPVNKNQTAPVSNDNKNNVTTVYLTSAPTYQQPKKTTFTYQHDKTVKAGWNVGVSGGGMQQCIGSAINGDYLGAAVAGFGSISIGKTPASEEHIFYTGEATGQDVGFPDVNQNNSYSSNNNCNNNYGGYAVNGFYPNGRPTWR